MKFSRSLALVAFAVTAQAAGKKLSSDPFDQWHGPKQGDVRGPCPFLNTFANHGFLPRTGKYITKQDLVDGLFEAVNFDKGLTEFLFNFAISTNPEPNSTWFSLDHLSRHNVLEHDASLSRIDAFHGHGEVFNKEAFDETVSYYGDIVTVESGVDAIIARMKTCKASNPEYSISNLGLNFIFGETGAFIAVLGDPKTLTAEKKRVEFLFRNERLPIQLGWKRPDTPFTEETLQDILGRVRIEYEKRGNSTAPTKRSGRLASRIVHGSAGVVY